MAIERLQFSDLGLSAEDIPGRERAWFRGLSGQQGVSRPPDVPGLIDDLRNIREMIAARAAAGAQFSLVFNGVAFRVWEIPSPGGVPMYLLKRLPSERPLLRDQAFRFSPLVAGEILRSGAWNGLTIMASAQGHGRTTTGTAAHLSLIEHYGGMGLAIEEYMGYAINGPVGSAGWSTQADTSRFMSVAEAVRSLGGTPADRYFIDGVDDPAAATQAVRLAARAPVVTTVMASGLAEAIEVVATSVGRETLASAISQVVMQVLKDVNGSPAPHMAQVAFCHEDEAYETRLRDMIATGQHGRIGEEAQAQLAALRQGGPAAVPAAQ